MVKKSIKSGREMPAQSELYNEVVINDDSILYFLNGKFHRIGGPAVIRYYNDGPVCYKEYYLNGKLHRIDGPAVIGYNDNDSLGLEEYYINDKRHRTNGPAEIYYNKDGSIHYERYYLNGEEVNKSEVMK